MKKENITATTVKIDDDLYTEFKVLAIRKHLSLQKFTDKCVRLYVAGESFSGSFREAVNDFLLPTLSTSGSFKLSI